MKTETEMLLFNISQLVDQAGREPEKAEAIVNMIASLIAKAHRRRCLKCHRSIEKFHKFRKLEAGNEHILCDNPDSYITDEEYVARFGLASFNRMHPERAIH